MWYKGARGFEGEILVAALNTPFLLYAQTPGLVHIGNKCPEKGSRVVYSNGLKVSDPGYFQSIWINYLYYILKKIALLMIVKCHSQDCSHKNLEVFVYHLVLVCGSADSGRGIRSSRNGLEVLVSHMMRLLKPAPEHRFWSVLSMRKIHIIDVFKNPDFLTKFPKKPTKVVFVWIISLVELRVYRLFKNFFQLCVCATCMTGRSGRGYLRRH